MWQNSKYDKTKTTPNVAKILQLKIWQNSTTQYRKKLNKSKCDKKQKTQNVTKFKNTKFNEILNSKIEILRKIIMWQNSMIQNVTKLKNKNWDQTHKQKVYKTKIKLTIVTQIKNSNCDKCKTQMVTKFKSSNCDKTQQLKMWQNLKPLIVTKLNTFKCEKTQFMTKVKKRY